MQRAPGLPCALDYRGRNVSSQNSRDMRGETREAVFFTHPRLRVQHAAAAVVDRNVGVYGSTAFADDDVRV